MKNPKASIARLAELADAIKKGYGDKVRDAEIGKLISNPEHRLQKLMQRTEDVVPDHRLRHGEVESERQDRRDHELQEHGRSLCAAYGLTSAKVQIRCLLFSRGALPRACCHRTGTGKPARAAYRAALPSVNCSSARS